MLYYIHPLGELKGSGYETIQKVDTHGGDGA